MNILFLNGPPGCGKDEVAKVLYLRGVPHKAIKFAQPLRDLACYILDIPDHELEDRKRSDPTVRKLMIALSENTIKPVLGNQWFARIAARKVLELKSQNILITDSGFDYEVEEFLKYISANTHEQIRTELWHIHRPGHDFAADSRSYVQLPEYVGIPIVVDNDGDLFSFHDKVSGLARFFYGY
jgi:hypothetical protein